MKKKSLHVYLSNYFSTLLQSSPTYLSEELSPLVLPVGPRGVEDDVGDLDVGYLRRRLGGRHLDEKLSQRYAWRSTHSGSGMST